MYQTRMERLEAKRRQRRRRRRKLLILMPALLGTGVFLSACLFLWERGMFQPHTVPPAPVQVKPAHQPEPVVQLSFAGDVIMAGRVETLLREKGFDFPYQYVHQLFQQDDYTIANLETPVTNRGVPAGNKEYVYKSPPEAIPALKAAGVDLVNLANNHSLDQGVEGLLDTFAVLDENGIAYVGAGADADRAYAPVIVERNGMSIAFFGFSRVIPDTSWHAGQNKTGVASTYDPARAVEAIRMARENVDLVVVIAHWGKERVDYPVGHQKELARAYIDAGADLVIGGHPHVLQGFERYQNKWIAYSLGNFVFTRSVYPITWETMILQATCTKQGDCTLKMLPFHAELGQAVPMNEQEGARLLQRIESISTDVRIEPDGSIHPKAAPVRQ